MSMRTPTTAFSRGEMATLLVALAAFALAGWLGRQALQSLLQGYLAAWLFCLAIPLGSMVWLCIHTLTGGRWGRVLADEWHAGTRLLPLVGLLWLPLWLGARWLLPWAGGARGAQVDPPHWYLNLPFLWLRGGVCLALWLGMAWRQRRWRRMLHEAPSLAEQGFAGVALVVLLLTISITGVDWIMSLVPAWRSTALGVLLMTSFMTAAMALAVTRQAAVASMPGQEPSSLQLRRDFGNLLLACVLGWAYLAFMDYLTAWIADQPSETVWYLPRLQWPWLILPIALLVLHLMVPMLALLPRRGKQHARVLAGVAALVAVMQGVNMAWLVSPGVRCASEPLVWSDPVAWLAVGLCMATAWRVTRRRLAAMPLPEETR